MIEQLYRTRQVAQLLNVSERQVRRWIDRGDMKAVHVHQRGKGGLRLVPESAIKEFLDRHAVNGYRCPEAASDSHKGAVLHRRRHKSSP